MFCHVNFHIFREESGGGRWHDSTGTGGRFESRTAASVHAKHLPVSALRASCINVASLYILWSELTQKQNSVVFNVASVFLLNVGSY